MTIAIRLLAASMPLLGGAQAAVNALTPQMGWNTWNTFHGDFNQSVIERTADLLVSTGLRDAGYEYLVVDDGWRSYNRTADGRQQANATKFPSGMAALGDYIHRAGLKYGIYSDNGIYGCLPNTPGSWGYEELDAVTYAEWGVDYLKYDNCGSFEAGTVAPPARFGIMRDALLKSGRDILYSLCQWGDQFPWFWADQIGHSYRMSGDITALFSDKGTDCACRTAYCLNTGYAGCSVMTIMRKMREVSQFQHPGSFADMDMLEIGVANMTLNEQRTHFSFWAALKSPLIIGADLTTISDESLSVLKNKDIIKISQDKLGTAVNYLPSLSDEEKSQVWAGPLSNGRTVVLAFNELNTTQAINVPFSGVPGLDGSSSYKVREVWSKSRQGKTVGELSMNLTTHETKVFIIQ